MVMCLDNLLELCHYLVALHEVHVSEGANF